MYYSCFHTKVQEALTGILLLAIQMVLTNGIFGFNNINIQPMSVSLVRKSD